MVPIASVDLFFFFWTGSVDEIIETNENNQ